MIALFVAVFLGGCAFAPPDCASGYWRNSSGNCEPTDEVSDTGGGDSIVAPFVGSISIEVDADADLVQLSDSCEGDLGLDVVDGEMTGTLSCSFVGEIGATLGGEIFEGSIAGQVNEAGAVDGNIVLDLGVFGILDSTWSGTASSEQVSGDFAGDMTVLLPGGALEAQVAYSGTLEALAIDQ